LWIQILETHFSFSFSFFYITILWLELPVMLFGFTTAFGVGFFK